MAGMSERVRAARAGLPAPVAIEKARQAGYDDAIANRPRAAEHESYLDKSPHDRTLSIAYNRGRVAGMQQALQDRFGDPPTDH